MSGQQPEARRRVKAKPEMQLSGSTQSTWGGEEVGASRALSRPSSHQGTARKCHGI